MTGGAPTRSILQQGFGAGLLVMALKNPDFSQGGRDESPKGPTDDPPKARLSHYS